MAGGHDRAAARWCSGRQRARSALRSAPRCSGCCRRAVAVDIIPRALLAPRAIRPRQAAAAAGGQAPLMQAVAEYLGALQSERGASRNTLAAYRRDLDDFLRFLAHAPAHARRTSAPSDVVTWLEGLRARGLAPPASRAACRPCAGSIVTWCARAMLRRDPTEHLDTPRAARPLPRALSLDSARALVEAPDARRPAGVRDRAVLELLYATGMRASECLGLRPGGSEPQRPATSICTGKGGKQRLVPVGAEALEWVRRYLQRGAAARHAAPRRGPALRESARRAALAPVAVDDRAARRGHGRAQAARVAARAASLVRQPPARGRRRPALGPGDARPRRHLDHADLHAPADARRSSACIAPSTRGRQ